MVRRFVAILLLAVVGASLGQTPGTKKIKVAAAAIRVDETVYSPFASAKTEYRHAEAGAIPFNFLDICYDICITGQARRLGTAR
ncbi:hypothetical protein GCM10011408_25280 [Dyella caseinilytica]|nr:hypothetical protein GCM10011408_25280 [Dyella caseinilytica]